MEKLVKDNYVATLSYIKHNLNMSIHDFKTRNEIVKSILDKCPYIKTYWLKKNNVHLTNGYLEDQSPYGMMISQLTNYLLMSDESKKMSKENDSYTFTDEYMKKKINREIITIEERPNTNKFKTNNDSESSKINIVDSKRIDMFLSRQKNRIKFPRVKITKEDLKENSYKGEVLRDYQRIINICLSKRENKTYNRRLLNWQLFLLRDDQKLSKSMLAGYFNSRELKYPQPQKQLNLFDWRDKRTLLKLLQMRGDFYKNYDLWLTCFDLQILLDKLDLTPTEDMIRKMMYLGLTFHDMEYYTGFSYNRIYYKIVPSIISKIQWENLPYDVEVNPNILDKIEKRDKNKNIDNYYVQN